MSSTFFEKVLFAALGIFLWIPKPPLEHCSVEVNTVSAAVLLDNVNTTTVIVICQYFFEKSFIYTFIKARKAA